MERKKTLGMVLAVFIIAGFYISPVPQGLNEAGKNVLGLLLAGLVLWITEALPLAVTALALIILQPLLGIEDISAAFKAFMSPVIFFIIATFGISIAIMKTPLAARIARWLLQRAGNSSERVVLAFMIGTAVLSAIISVVPATAIFMSLALGILEASDCQPGTSNLGKCLMIGVPFGAMIGGMATPTGSAVNIMALYFLETYGQVRVPFIDWMVVGIPICLILVPISWYILVKVFKPEPIDQRVIEDLDREIEAGLSLIEIKLLIVTGVMMVLWIGSSWIPVIDITMVAIAGLIAYFIPGIDVLEWDEFAEGVGWEAVLMVGGVTSLGAAVVQTGLGEWFVSQSLQGLASWGIIPATMAVGALANLLHLVIPISPAIIAVTVPSLLDLSGAANINPAIFAITTSFLAGCSMLLPLDAVPLITFTKRYYSMWDMFKVGSITSLIWVIIAGVWVPAAISLL